jgi:hypothetical protein
VVPPGRRDAWPAGQAWAAVEDRQPWVPCACRCVCTFLPVYIRGVYGICSSRLQWSAAHVCVRVCLSVCMHLFKHMTQMSRTTIGHAVCMHVRMYVSPFESAVCMQACNKCHICAQSRILVHTYGMQNVFFQSFFETACKLIYIMI